MAPGAEGIAAWLSPRLTANLGPGSVLFKADDSKTPLHVI